MSRYSAKTRLGEVSKAFKDISFAFTRNPSTNDLNVLRNEDAIKASVKNLVAIAINERPFNKYVGTRITSQLFETEFPDVNSINSEIESILKNFEPRIKLTSIDIFRDDDTYEIEVVIEYKIIGDEVVQRVSYLLVRES